MEGPLSVKAQLYQIAKVASHSHTKSLTTAYVFAALLYSAEVWGTVPGYIRKTLQMLQLAVAQAVLVSPTFRWNTACLLAAIG